MFLASIQRGSAFALQAWRFLAVKHPTSYNEVLAQVANIDLCKQ